MEGQAALKRRAARPTEKAAIPTSPMSGLRTGRTPFQVLSIYDNTFSLYRWFERSRPTTTGGRPTLLVPMFCHGRITQATLFS